jgi:hypothetical protein
VNYDALGLTPANVFKTKTQVFAESDIKRTKYAMIMGETCTLLRQPTKSGLKEKRYINTWWKKID